MRFIKEMWLAIWRPLVAGLTAVYNLIIRQLTNIMSTAGLACIVTAGFLIAKPLGWLVLGVGLVTLSYFMERG